MTEVGGPLRFVRLAPKVVMQNDRDFVNVVLLYLYFTHFIKAK